MNTLAFEWGTLLFPEEPVESAEAFPVGDLSLFMAGFERVPESTYWQIERTPNGEAKTEVKPDTESTPETNSDAETVSTDDDLGKAEDTPDSGSVAPVAPVPPLILLGPLPHPDIQSDSEPAQTPEPSPHTLVNTVLNLPVTVIVELARKRIDLRQLLAIAPGGLITFNKSCEGPLSLYVRNQRYCEGEAVKIGEKFGLKINRIGSSSQ